MSLFDIPQAVASVAKAALALQLGAREEDLDQIETLLNAMPLPTTMSEAVAEMREAITEENE